MQILSIFFTQLSVAYVASFIFYIIVNYIPEQEKKRKYQGVAFKQLRYPLSNHLDLLVYMYKATIINKPNINPINVSDIFDDYYYNEMKLFDIHAKAPVISSKSWFEFINSKCLAFADSLENTVGKYSIYLDDSTINLIESIRHSLFMQIYLQEATSFINIDNNLLIIDDYITLSNTDDKSMLIFDNNIANIELKEYIKSILNLIDLCNRENDKPISIDRYNWGDDSFPKYGSARFDKDKMVKSK